MSGLKIGGLRAHEMGKFKCDPLIKPGPLCRLELHSEFIKFDGQKADGHIAVECLGIGPAFHFIFISQFFVDRKEGIEFVIVDVTILKGTRVNHVVNTIKYLTPIFLVLLN